jgi:hypothetical protein
MIAKKSLVMLFGFILMIISASRAQEVEHYSMLKFHLENRKQIKDLKILGLTLDCGPMTDNQVQVVVNQAELKRVQMTNLNYEIMIGDMNAHYDTNIKISPQEMQILQQEMNKQYSISGFEFGSMGGYYTNDEIVSELDSMRLLYPDIITEKQLLGLSIEGREIWHVKISDHADLDEEEPEVLYTALHHAREPQSMATVIYFMYYLLENYGRDPQVNYIIDNRELHFIPVVNPDGYVYNQLTNPGGGGMWRKNRRMNADTTYGVDLNRNYGYQWGFSDIGSSPDPSSNEYRGSEPFSEPETRTVRDFCENHQIKLCFNYHTFGNVLIYPWGYNDQQTPDSLLYRELANSLTEVNNYLYGTGSETIGYVVNGDADDWMYGEQNTKNKIISMTPEVGSSFWPDPAQIYPLAEENLQANILLAIGKGAITTSTSPQVQSISAGRNSAVAGIDSLHILAIISNPSGSELTVQTFIDNISHSYLDTVHLYDDGTHSDLHPNDDIFSSTIIAPPIEDIFNLHTYIRSLDGETHFLSALRSFTTIGPVELSRFEIASADTIPNHGDQLRLNLELINRGLTAIALNITTKTSCLDTCATVIGFDRIFGDIAPGETASGNRSYTVQFSNVCTDSLWVSFKVDIYSDNYLFWGDTFSVFVHKDLTNIARAESDIPREFSLYQNFPNPFNPKTIINYQLPMNSDVELSIYNLLGQRVATLFNKHQRAGYHQVEWDASNHASGVYFYRIEAGEFQDVKKMILIR